MKEVKGGRGRVFYIKTERGVNVFFLFSAFVLMLLLFIHSNSRLRP